MYTFPYTDSEEKEFEVTFDYDPDMYGEDDPSQSPWHYITIQEIVDSEGTKIDFTEEQLTEIAKYLWKNYKYEF